MLILGPRFYVSMSNPETHRLVYGHFISTLLITVTLGLVKGSLTHGAEPFLRSCQLCSHSRTSQCFMEPEGSLPRSQEPSTGRYPEPDPSNPYHPILSLSPTYVLVIPVVSFLLDFPPISYMHSASPPFVLHALPISFSLT
jgi:hypothetical protein